MRVFNRTNRSFSYVAEEDGKTRLGNVSDVSDVVELVGDRRSVGAESHPVLGYHVASIPIDLLEQWAQKISGGLLSGFDVADDDALLNRFLDEHGKLRVKGGWQ